MANPFDQFDAPQPQQMPQPQANPFDEFDAPQPQPTTREPSGFFDAFVGGYQGSATGLAFRGKLPDIVLNPEEADWYERLGAGAGSVVSELPIGVVGGAIGAIGGGAAGSAVPVVGNVAGAVVGGGAGSMALPAAIRESYIQAYTKGEIESSADFLNRVGLVLKQTAKEGLIGGLTAGAGRAATLTAQTAGAGAKTTLAAGMTAEASTLVVAPAALEGRLPEPQEFMDAAILLLGFKGATVGGAQLVKGAAKLAEIYRRTGKTPIEVMADAQRDPTIAEDLAASVDVYHGTKAQGVGIEQLSDSADLGPHFTVNRKTAEIFANDKGTSGTVLEGTARFSKSIELPDLATWFPTEVAQAIDNVRGVKPQADGQTPFQAKVWRAMEDARIAAVDSGASAADASAASNAAGYKVIRDALKADGYDSIKYTNKFEGEPADTYIALDISKVKAKATPTSETPSDAQRDPTIAEDLAAAKPADEFTGTITGVHGSERPLDSIKPAAEVLAESRYDGSGGVWGDGFYSADSGDYSWFRGSDLRMADYNAATTVESTFSRAAIFTPETTVALLKSLGVKGVDTPEQLAQILRDKGYDGAIVRQFAPADIDALMLKLQAEGVTSDTFIDQGGESAFMNQIVHFAPDKGVRIVGEEATIGPLVRERRKLKEELNAKAEARGFNHANDAYGTIYDVEKYAERRTETEKQNYDYVLKMAGDKYPRAKEFADETATEAARLKELDRKISGMAKPPKPETPPDAPEIPRAYQEQARQENARNAVPPPSKQSAEFIEKPFAEVPQLPGEPVLKTHVNYNYLNTTDDVKGAMSRLSELYEDNIRTATRDKVSWEQTYAEARDIYRISTGEEPPPTPLANADYAKLAADLYARKQLLTSGAEQLINLRNEYVKARAENRATDQMRLEILAQVDRIGKAQAEVRGAQAEVGRALNILKSTNRDKAYYDELNEVLNQRFKTGDNLADTANRPTFDNIMDMLGQYENPSQVLKFASKATKPNWLDKFMEVYTAGLVSGVLTQTANIFGNATMLPLRPLVDAAAVGFGAFSKKGDRVAAGEPLARATGTIMGTVDAVRIASAVWKSGVPYGMTPDQHRNAIPGKAGEIVRLPFLGLATSDAFFRVLNERAEAYALGARQATKEGLNPATREFRERVVQIAADPPEAMAQQIEAAGLRGTFNAPLGSLGKIALTARRQSPLLTFLIPFVQSPINSVKEMLRLSPLAPAVKEWRDEYKKGGAARHKAIAELTVGFTLGVTTVALLGDNISGNGDVDPGKRRTDLANDWQPYSIKIGGKWYSYQRIQPLGGLLGMYADTKEIWQQMTEEEQNNAVAAIGAAFANAITNQTMLMGITNFIEALSDPERFMPRYLQNQVASLVPGISGQTASLIDPYRREVYSIYDAVINRIPFASQTLLPQRDVFGEPIENKDRIGVISPITVTTESGDKVRAEAARLGLGVGVTKKYIELKDLGEDDLGRVNLTPEQRDVLAEQSGKMAYTILDQLVNNPGWDDMPDIVKRQTMERVFEDARKYGRTMAVPPEQLLQEYERINEGLGKRLQAK